MKKFVLLYRGFETSTDGTMEAWTKWFGEISDHLVDSGNPFGPGKEITKAGTKDLAMDKDAITGYSIISAASVEEAQEIAKNCPITSGVQIYEAMAM